MKQQRPFPYAHLLPRRSPRPARMSDLAAVKRQALAALGIQPNQPRQLVENPELVIALRRMRYYDGHLAAARQAKGEEVW